MGGPSSLQAEIHSSLKSKADPSSATGATGKRVSKKHSLQSSRFDSASDFSDSEGDFSASGVRRRPRPYHPRLDVLTRGQDAAKTKAATSLEDDPELSFESYSAGMASRDEDISTGATAAVLPDFKVGRFPEEEETVGELRVPQDLGRGEALASPLGSVPSLERLNPQQQQQQHLGSPITRDSGLGMFPSAEFANEIGGPLTLTSATAIATTAARTHGDGGTTLGDELGGDEFVSGQLDDTDGEGVSSELEEALRKLTPEEVERRRKRLNSGAYR